MHRNYSSGAIIWGSVHPTEENILLLNNIDLSNKAAVKYKSAHFAKVWHNTFSICYTFCKVPNLWMKNVQYSREILVEMVIRVTPGHWKFRISVCIILEHLKKKYCDIMARLRDKTISQLKSSKIKVWELPLVFTLYRRNATNGN